MWILLFSEVTPFEFNVSKILSPYCSFIFLLLMALCTVEALVGGHPLNAKKVSVTGALAGMVVIRGHLRSRV